jgi:hypothetical protein
MATARAACGIRTHNLSVDVLTSWTMFPNWLAYVVILFEHNLLPQLYLLPPRSVRGKARTERSPLFLAQLRAGLRAPATAVPCCLAQIQRACDRRALLPRAALTRPRPPCCAASPSSDRARDRRALHCSCSSRLCATTRRHPCRCRLGARGDPPWLGLELAAKTFVASPTSCLLSQAWRGVSNSPRREREDA